MTRRTPARLLALSALVAVTAALFAVLTRGGPDAEREAAPAATTAQPAATTRTTPRKRRAPRTYTVRSGDTPSGIAEKTGVSVARLLELNPDLDPQSLQTGARLKLR